MRCPPKGKAVRGGSCVLFASHWRYMRIIYCVYTGLQFYALLVEWWEWHIYRSIAACIALVYWPLPILRSYFDCDLKAYPEYNEQWNLLFIFGLSWNDNVLNLVVLNHSERHKMWWRILPHTPYLMTGHSWVYKWEWLSTGSFCKGHVFGWCFCLEVAHLWYRWSRLIRIWFYPNSRLI